MIGTTHSTFKDPGQLDAHYINLLGKMQSYTTEAIIIEKNGKETEVPMKNQYPIGKCLKCNKNPMFDPYNSLCIQCQPNMHKNQKCYNCDICKNERTELEKIEKDFELSRYDHFNGNRVEVWKCKICKYSILFEILNPGMNRTVLHYKAKKEHIEKKCDKLSSGEIIIEGI